MSPTEAPGLALRGRFPRVSGDESGFKIDEIPLA